MFSHQDTIGVLNALGHHLLTTLIALVALFHHALLDSECLLEILVSLLVSTQLFQVFCSRIECREEVGMLVEHLLIVFNSPT